MHNLRTLARNLRTQKRNYQSETHCIFWFIIDVAIDRNIRSPKLEIKLQWDTFLNIQTIRKEVDAPILVKFHMPLRPLDIYPVLEDIVALLDKFLYY